MSKNKQFRNTHPHIKNEGQKTTPRLDELQYEIANEVGFEKISRESTNIKKRKENPKF